MLEKTAPLIKVDHQDCVWPVGTGSDRFINSVEEIFAIADVDGALVGGASLKASDFIPIVAAAAEARTS